MKQLSLILGVLISFSSIYGQSTDKELLEDRSRQSSMQSSFYKNSQFLKNHYNDLRINANKEDEQSMLELAMFLEDNPSFRINDNLISWYEKCVKLFNSAEALNRLGVIYKKGLYETNLDYKKAFNYFHQSAELENSQGQYSLGYLFYKGIGCEQNYYKAIELFERSVSKGHAGSMYMLGLCLGNGYGAKKDLDRSIKLLDQASKQGFFLATDELRKDRVEFHDGIRSLFDNIEHAYKEKSREKLEQNSFNLIEYDDESIFEQPYEGYLLRYDYSGEHVIGAKQIMATFDKPKNSGSLIINDYDNSKPLILTINESGENYFVFESAIQSQKDHFFSVDLICKYHKLDFEISVDDKYIYLIGKFDVHNVSLVEPAKPQKLVLRKPRQLNKSNGNKDSFVEDLVVFPNPFRHTTNVKFKILKDGDYTLNVISEAGVIMKSEKLEHAPKGEYVFPFVSDSKSGIYFFELLSSRGKSTTKAIKIN